MNQIKCTYAIVIIAAFVDILVSTIIMLHATDYKTFLVQAIYFNFGISNFDLWLFCIIRFSFSIGCVLGVVRGRNTAIKRVKNIMKAKWLVLMTTVAYLAGKLLASLEYSDAKQFWLWIALGTTFFFTAVWIGIILLLSQLYFTPTQQQNNISNLSIVVDNNSESGSQVSLVSNDSDDSKEEDEMPTISSYSATSWRLLQLCKPDWPYILSGFIFLLAASVTEIFIPYFEGHVINDIILATSDFQIRSAIVVLALITFGTSVCTGIRGGLFMIAVARMNIRVRNLLFQSVVKQDIGFFDQSSTGEITSRLTSDVTKMSDEVTLNINVFLRGIIKVIGTTIFMFVLSYRLTIVTLISLPLIAIIIDYFGEWYKVIHLSIYKIYTLLTITIAQWLQQPTIFHSIIISTTFL